MPTAVERPNFDLSPRSEGPDILISFAVDTFRGQCPSDPSRGGDQLTFVVTGNSLALNIAVDPNNPNHGPPELDLTGVNVAGLDHWHHG